LHEVWNESDRRRVVLVVDLWHPDLDDDEVALLSGLYRYGTAIGDNRQRYWARNEAALQRSRDFALVSNGSDRVNGQFPTLASSHSYAEPKAKSTNERRLGISWGPERQTLYCGTESFTHEGPAQTEPSHDLAHLLIAAAGNLPWRPAGEDKLVRHAEYNAVFVETLLDQIYNCVVFRSIRPDAILAECLRYGRWFVEEHFAPFPMPAEEAYRLFCRNINAAPLVRLSPYFFAQKRLERPRPNDVKLSGCRVRNRPWQDPETWEISFGAADVPATDGEALTLQRLAFDVLSQIT